MNFKAIIT